MSLPLPAAANLTQATASTGGIQVGGHMVANVGKDCWWECGQKSGYCDYCGSGNACCKQGDEGAPGECQGELGFHTWHHECIAPRAPIKAGVAGAAAAAGAVGAAAAVAPVQSLMNIGKDCWWECGQKSGACPFCGAGNAWAH